jgi:hypothetical protein
MRRRRYKPKAEIISSSKATETHRKNIVDALHDHLKKWHPGKAKMEVTNASSIQKMR